MENVVSPVLVPKDAVRRILASAGVEIPDKEAYWLGLHMERFVKYTRTNCELLDLPVCSESYRASVVRGGAPDWQLAQIDQALALFARGTERWQWVRAREDAALGRVCG